LQSASLLAIARGVALQLGRPVVAIHAGPSAMLRTRVPEAPVNEYCDPAFGECNVWADQLSVYPDRIVLPEAETETVYS